MSGWVPVEACTLPTVEQPLRAAELDSLFAEALTNVEQHAPTTATFTFAPGHAERVRDLTVREAACCSFFNFTVIAQANHVDLFVEVPGSRADVLTGLIQIACPDS
ncbi:MAG: hypothetical protein JWN77_1588 [Frankiales bacterium]|jgi:hypothetical protein|nr:hypothetical protein [Frankiales bacterium]